MADLGDPKNWLPGEASLNVIRAAIASYNAERPAIAKAQTRRVALMMGGFVVVALAAGAAAIASGNAVLAGIGIGFGFFGAPYVWSKAVEPTRQFQQALRQRLFPVIFGFIPKLSYQNNKPPRFLQKLKATGLLSWSSTGHDDWFAGEHDGLEFELSETEFFTGSGKHKSSLLKALVFHSRREFGFDGLLLAQQKTNAVHRYFRDLFGKNLRTVKSGLNAVDETHEFRTDKEGPVQAQLSLEMAKVLDWLQRDWRHGPVQIVFQAKDCYLLLAAKANHFELPHIDAGDIDFERDVLPLIRDMVVLLAIGHLIAKIGIKQ